jgi:putative ABC transport system ATP-binding protein
MENSYLIETEDLIKTYPMGAHILVALNKVNLSFKKGEFAHPGQRNGNGKKSREAHPQTGCGSA